MSNSAIIKRRKSKAAKIGNLFIGGNHPISVQSMTSCDVKDIKSTLEQIGKLEAAGCELIRIAFPDIQSCQFIPIIKSKAKTPIMADVHFNYLIALEALKYNIDGIRLNPGNIKKETQIIQVIEKAQKKKAMIRFGINSGSLNKSVMEKYKEPNYLALVEETEQLLDFLKKLEYQNIVLSIKSSNVLDTIKANEIIAQKCDYPLHIGITEAGFEQSGIVKTTAGISILLYEGIGDTIRVSLTGDPVKEVLVGNDILRTLGIRKKGINLITCPTCGRCQVDIYKIAKKIESNLRGIKTPLTVAIMGCIVNGPGEAKFADAGIAFSKKEAMLFKKGTLIGRYNSKEAIEILESEIRSISKHAD
ncbi:MAG TPA: flavodoxin-dependent (E)-4-hydroxy-3-methylbut-2-enyl-diphosphate synthase [Atribacterota bacterium]|nr:flavodoxin-dependent (E)-4-hydroxy-3-methylbut-2-enyl-diphosphate synthase [Atribacterota bacterium]